MTGGKANADQSSVLRFTGVFGRVGLNLQRDQGDSLPCQPLEPRGISHWNPQSICSDLAAWPKRCWCFCQPALKLPPNSDATECLGAWLATGGFQSRLGDILQCGASHTLQLRTGCTLPYPSAHSLRASMLSLRPWEFFLTLHWALFLFPSSWPSPV